MVVGRAGAGRDEDFTNYPPLVAQGGEKTATQQTMKMKVALKDLEPNPYRELENYPIDRDKVDALKASFESSGVWPVLCARKRNGKFQLAFGHHRLTALREKFPASHKIEVNVMPLGNRQMLVMMANENMEEYAHLFGAVLETVKACVIGHASGDPELQLRESRSGNHYKLSELLTSPDGEVKLDANGVAEMLGWWQVKDKKASKKVRDALNALYLIRAGQLKEGDLLMVRNTHARVIISASLRIYKDSIKAEKEQEEKAAKARTEANRRKAQADKEKARKAREAAKAKAAEQAELARRSAKAKDKEHEHTAAEIAHEFDKVETGLPKAKGKPKRLPGPDGGARKLARDIDKVFAPTCKEWRNLDLLYAAREHFSTGDLRIVKEALLGLAQRACGQAARLIGADAEEVYKAELQPYLTVSFLGDDETNE